MKVRRRFSTSRLKSSSYCPQTKLMCDSRHGGGGEGGGSVFQHALDWRRQWCASQHAMVQGCLPRGVCFREVFFLPGGVLEVCLPRGCLPGGCLGRGLCLPRGPAMNDLPRGCLSTGVSSGGVRPRKGLPSGGVCIGGTSPDPEVDTTPLTQRQTAPR